MLQLEFHILAWSASLKEPLRCGFKRNSLCGSRAGREPFMVGDSSVLQCRQPMTWHPICNGGGEEKLDVSISFRFIS